MVVSSTYPPMAHIHPDMLLELRLSHVVHSEEVHDVDSLSDKRAHNLLKKQHESSTLQKKNHKRLEKEFKIIQKDSSFNLDT